MEQMSRVERRMGFFVMLSLWCPWMPGRPNGAYSNSFPVMKFESVGFPFEEGPVLASKSHSIHKHTVCIRYYGIPDTVLSLLFVQWYQPTCSPQPHHSSPGLSRSSSSPT